MRSLWKCFCSPLQQLNARVAWRRSAAALEVCKLILVGVLGVKTWCRSDVSNTNVSSLNAEGEFLMLFKYFTSLRFIWGDVHHRIIYSVETGTSGLSFCSGLDFWEVWETRDWIQSFHIFQLTVSSVSPTLSWHFRLSLLMMLTVKQRARWRPITGVKMNTGQPEDRASSIKAEADDKMKDEKLLLDDTACLVNPARS